MRNFEISQVELFVLDGEVADIASPTPGRNWNWRKSMNGSLEEGACGRIENLKFSIFEE
jgi:hypothetical protein